jgi:hypothetical protein
MAFDLKDYITVAERVAEFYRLYPDGRIVSSVPEVVAIDNATFVAVTTKVYRTSDDPIPCVGSAWEPFPGKTPYTRESEMMNAETAAIGRAVAAAGIAVNRSISSRDEIENRTSSPKPVSATVSDDLVGRIAALPDDIRRRCKDGFVKKFGKPNELSADALEAAEAFVSYWETQIPNS